MSSSSPGSWASAFGHYWEKAEFHLANYLRNQGTLLYTLMTLFNGGRVLEVGCGSGRGCILFKRLRPDCEVVASDINREVCQGALQYVKTAMVDVSIVQADIFHLPFNNNSFNVVFSQGVMEHFTTEQVQCTLQEQGRVAPYILVDVPLHDWFIRHNREQWRDEWKDVLKLFASEWISLLTQEMELVDLHLSGFHGEEENLLALLRRKNWIN